MFIGKLLRGPLITKRASWLRGQARNHDAFLAKAIATTLHDIWLIKNAQADGTLYRDLFRYGFYKSDVACN
jgi:hypothetical protein